MKLKAILTAILLAFVFVIATPQRASADWSRICYAFSVDDWQTGIDHWDEDEPETFYYASYSITNSYALSYPAGFPPSSEEEFYEFMHQHWILEFNLWSGGMCN